MYITKALSSLLFLCSAFSSIKTENILWISANFIVSYTSFMYNLHKFDLYEKYPNKKIYYHELSEVYDHYLLNDYIVISIMSYVNIDNVIIKNLILVSIIIEYCYTKGIVRSKNLFFTIGIVSRFMKMVSLYKIGLLSYDMLSSSFLNILIIMNILVIRNKYGYKRETKTLNIILTAFWHYYMTVILCNVSYSMFVELNTIDRVKYTN